ncbi:hypothetical protein HDV00_002585 [Rhizophlyctis rosea]|nr:hypothetical protein HDV00_002585 [Rhizophlyctis rosea]
MGKREADIYLTQHNVDEQEEPDEAPSGTFQQASADILKGRVIKKPKGRLASRSSEGPPSGDGQKSVFSGFSFGAGPANPPSTAPTTFGLGAGAPASTIAPPIEGLPNTTPPAFGFGASGSSLSSNTTSTPTSGFRVSGSLANSSIPTFSFGAGPSPAGTTPSTPSFGFGGKSSGTGSNTSLPTSAFGAQASSPVNTSSTTPSFSFLTGAANAKPPSAKPFETSVGATSIPASTQGGMASQDASAPAPSPFNIAPVVTSTTLPSFATPTVSDASSGSKMALPTFGAPSGTASSTFAFASKKSDSTNQDTPAPPQFGQAVGGNATAINTKPPNQDTTASSPSTSASDANSGIGKEKSPQSIGALDPKKVEEVAQIVKKLRGLNYSVVNLVEKDPYMDLSKVFEAYNGHRATILAERPDLMKYINSDAPSEPADVQAPASAPAHSASASASVSGIGSAPVPSFAVPAPAPKPFEFKPSPTPSSFSTPSSFASISGTAPTSAKAFSFGSNPSPAKSSSNPVPPFAAFGGAASASFPSPGVKRDVTPTSGNENLDGNSKPNVPALPTFNFGSTGASSNSTTPSALPFGFGTPSSNLKAAAPFSFAPAPAASFAGFGNATTNGGTAVAQGTEADGEDGDEAMPPDAQIGDALMKGPGEEQEETVFEVKARVLKNADGWKLVGVGQLKLNKNKSTGKVRLLHRAEGSGRVLLNSATFPDMKVTVKKEDKTSTVTFSATDELGALKVFAARVKAEADADALAAAITSNKS